MRYLGGEPAFIGEPGTDNGVVICQEFDAAARKSSFLIFEAARVAQGPLTRILLDDLLYLGFHTGFSPEPPIPEMSTLVFCPVRK